MMAQNRLPARRVPNGDAGHRSRDATMSGGRFRVTGARYLRLLDGVALASWTRDHPRQSRRTKTSINAGHMGQV